MLALFYAVTVEEPLNIDFHLQPFETDHDLYIFKSEGERNHFINLLHENNTETSDHFSLVLIPSEIETNMNHPLSDYGLQTITGNFYVFEYLVSFFILTSEKDQTNRDAAFLQMEEHIIGTVKNGNENIYIVDRELEGLIEGIAKAYEVELEWIKVMA